WMRAGELVFDAPIRYRALSDTGLRNQELWNLGVGTTDGTTPFFRYVIRKKKIIEIGDFSCAQCHTRIMADGTVLKGLKGISLVLASQPPRFAGGQKRIMTE